MNIESTSEAAGSASSPSSPANAPQSPFAWLKSIIGKTFKDDDRVPRSKTLHVASVALLFKDRRKDLISDADLETLRSINARIAALAKQLEPLSFTSLRKEREKVRAAYKANPTPANLAAIENSKGINMYSVNENIAEMRKAVKGQMRKTSAEAVPIIEAARAKARIIIVKEMEALQQTELQTAARYGIPWTPSPAFGALQNLLASFPVRQTTLGGFKGNLEHALGGLFKIPK